MEITEYYTKSKDKFTLLNPEKPLGKGAEGNIYDVEGGKFNFEVAAKILHEDKAPSRKLHIERLIEYLSAKGTILADDSKDFALCWPLECLYTEADEFKGFLMQKAKGTNMEELILSNPKTRDREPSFEDYSVIYNICEAVNAVHSNKMVLGDLKPANILVDYKLKIWFVDLDSCQFPSNAGQMKTPHYSPPEANNKSQIEILPSWDYFSLGVVIYEFLTKIHPFNAAPKTETTENESDGIAANIRDGIAVIIDRTKIKKIHPPHDKVGKWPDKIRSLTERCFRDGHRDASGRPTPEDWMSALAIPPEILKFKAESMVLIADSTVKIEYSINYANSFKIYLNGKEQPGVTKASGTLNILLTEGLNTIKLVAYAKLGQETTTEEKYITGVKMPVFDFPQLPPITEHYNANMVTLPVFELPVMTAPIARFPTQFEDLVIGTPFNMVFQTPLNIEEITKVTTPPEFTLNKIRNEYVSNEIPVARKKHHKIIDEIQSLFLRILKVNKKNI